MRLGIDASNIRRGGGVTHLVELLRAADPVLYGFSEVFVWSGQATLEKIENRQWLRKVHVPKLDGGLLARSIWQGRVLSGCAQAAGCQLLFIPGGTFAGTFAPIVTLSQNLLPFEWKELRRFGWSAMTLKLILLRFTQSRTFRKAAGLIFLTHYAENAVRQVIKANLGKTAIIPHGIDQRFSLAPRPQKPIDTYSIKAPYKLIYVSIIDVYKHQGQVAEAVAKLRSEGFPVEIDLIGPAYSPAAKKLAKVLGQLDPLGEFIHLTGPIPYESLHAYYKAADLGVFASSCENLPIILLEGMAAGLPIACSKMGPMPEVLQDGGLYFDPEDGADIYRVLKALIQAPELRANLAEKSWAATKTYSWQKCAEHTFKFFADQVAPRNKG